MKTEEHGELKETGERAKDTIEHIESIEDKTEYDGEWNENTRDVIGDEP